MPPDRRVPSGKLCRAVRVVLVLVAVAFGLLIPGPAWADGTLVSADPPAGAALAGPPVAVILRFSAPVALDLSHVAVFTAGGAELAHGATQQPRPDRIRLPIQRTGKGDLTVAYHITFADGTSTAAAYRFSVGTSIAPAPLDGAAQRAVAASVRHTHQVDGFGATLLVLDGGVLLVVVFLLWIRPRDGRRMTLGALRDRDS